MKTLIAIIFFIAQLGATLDQAKIASLKKTVDKEIIEKNQEAKGIAVSVDVKIGEDSCSCRHCRNSRRGSKR